MTFREQLFQPASDRGHTVQLRERVRGSIGRETFRDASHHETELAFFSTAGDSLRQLADFWRPPHQNTTAYEVLMEHPLVDGRLYLRTEDGRVACYDLRKPQADP